MKPFFKPTIFSQLLRYFIPIVLLPLFGVLSLTYFQSRQAIQEEEIIYLQTLLNRHANHIESYIRERHGAVQTLSRLPIVRNALQEFRKSVESGKKVSGKPFSPSGELNAFLTSYKDTYGYEDLLLISREGEIFYAASGRKKFLTNLHNGHLKNTELALVFRKTVSFLESEISRFGICSITGKPAGFMVAPVFSRGKFVGVVALQLNNLELYRIINDYTGLGRTGEMVAGAKLENHVVFMTPSRHDPQAAFQRKLSLDEEIALPIRQAVNKQSGSGTAIDYRGEEVLAAWRYLPSIRWGLVIKQDAREAFASIENLKQLWIWSGIGSLLLVVGGTIFAARSFSRPIVELKELTKKVATGEWREEIQVTSNNEIGQLAQSFNHMNRELNKYHHQLEDLVQKRTAEVHRALELLTRQRKFLQLQKDIAHRANEDLPFDEVMRYSLKRICEETGWPVGHLFQVVHYSGVRLRPTTIWYLRNPNEFNTFKTITETIFFTPGIGLPGRVLETGKPAWIPDVTEDPNFPRAKLARDIGVKAGFAFPILTGTEIVGVMEFYSTEVMEPDEKLLEIMENIGTQLGRVEERQRSRNALQEAHDDLEHRVETRTAELVKANNLLKREIAERKKTEEKLHKYMIELERSNHELQDFAAIASHDLQEPLRKIIIFGDRLRDQLDDMEFQGVNYLERIQNSAERMSCFIQDLLKYSRVTTKAKPFERTNLKEVMDQVLIDLEARISECGGEVRVENLPVIQADPFQMQQLFQNLVANALKYHKPETPPKVCIRGRALKKGWWEIVVEDNGIGFEQKYASRIFKPFERLHNRNEYEGTGMGLAICRKIVFRHGGKIHVSSEPDHGTSVIMVFPENQPEPETQSRPEHPSENYSSPRRRQLLASNQ